MTITPPKCLECKHLTNADEQTCAAFPGGIPQEIYFGITSPDRLHNTRVEHDKPYPGDQGIQFAKESP